MKKTIVYEADFGYKVRIVSGVCSRVTLISCSSAMVKTLATVTRGYTGVYSAEELEDEEVQGFLKDLQSTKLGTPSEMLYFVFLVEGVTRAWTHQAVRTRVGASFVQESMRFLGAKQEYEVFCDIQDTVLRAHYIQPAIESVCAYDYLVKEGVPSQSARGILPTNILTRMFWGISLSTLQRIFNQRWCCQAQTDEWIPVLAQMKREISKIDPAIAEMLNAPIDRGENCGFNASFDRPCIWKQRTQKQQIDDILGEE